MFCNQSWIQPVRLGGGRFQ